MRTTHSSALLLGTRDRSSSQVELAKGAVHSCQIAPDTAVQIRAVTGALWVTFEGDPEDYVLECGESMVFAGPGLLVAEGLHAENAMEHSASVSVPIARWA